MNNHILVNVDTDSFSVCKPDQSVWSETEKDLFIKYINSHFPDLIRWENDGLYDKVLVLKSKNYVLVSDNKKKIKGSALTDAKRQPILLKYIEEIIDILLNEGGIAEITQLYNSYIKKANNIKDITEWCKKVTITDKILKCKDHHLLTDEEKKEQGIRSNETKVYDALHGKHVQEGDKIYLFFKSDRTYSLLEDWNGDYSKVDLMKNIHSCTTVFKNVVDTSGLVKYHLKSKAVKVALEALLNEAV